MEKFLNPRNDVAFKRLFGTEKNKEILISLLNEVLKKQLHKSIVDVSFLKTYQDPEHIARKQSIVDVLCKDEDNCTYIIEMQVASTGGFEERAQYYASKAYISQMNKGDKYEDLKRVIFLAFTEFSIFPKKQAYKSEHITLDKVTQEHDLDRISFTFVDLVKFGNTHESSKIEELNLEEKFYYFLQNAESINPEELEKLTKESEILDKAFKELNRVYWTEEEIEQYEDQEKGIRDNKAAMVHAIEKGREKGRKEGIQIGEKKGREEGVQIGEKKGKEEAELSMAKKMLEEGADIDFICKLTGLSKDKILKIQEVKN